MISELEFYGGARYSAVSVDVELKARQPRVRSFLPSVNNLNIKLPVATNLILGGPQFFLANLHASYDMKLTDSGDTELATIGPEQIAVVTLVGNIETIGVWLVQVRDVLGIAQGA